MGRKDRAEDVGAVRHGLKTAGGRPPADVRPPGARYRYGGAVEFGCQKEYNRI